MRSIAALTVLAFLALLVVPHSTEAANPPGYPYKFFKKEYVYGGAGYHQANTFNVPSTNATWKYLCYHRSYVSGYGFPQGSTIRVTLKDWTGEIVILDAGATVSDGLTFTQPVQVAQGFGWYAGPMTLTFDGDGVNGDAIIRVYGVLTQAECGKYFY